MRDLRRVRTVEGRGVWDIRVNGLERFNVMRCAAFPQRPRAGDGGQWEHVSERTIAGDMRMGGE